MNNFKIVDQTIAKPIVSVAILAYNHQDYIAQAIESVLMQKTKFSVQIVIAEDCSSDNTRSIILDYQKKYPEVIKLILQHKNVGARQNNYDLLSNLTGQYIAALEGDDYWTDPEKLRKQVDYLEANQDCNLVYHRSEVLDEESGKIELETLNNPDFTMKRDLNYLALNGNFMHTATVLYRNNFSLPQHLFKGVIGDYILWFLNGEKGKYGYIPDIMSVYRFWGGSVWGKKSLYFRLQSSIEMLCVLRDYTVDHRVKKSLGKKITTLIELLPLKSLNFKEKITFIIFILKVKPSYIFEFLKRGGRYIGTRK
ncbi:glycosyltransferase [Elizabethkingia meningoseptica]|uniref:glycosyltransferase n=1 Tax=Elizabethkingia meningoseptica TaxID=238 RepID=UPI0038923C54